MWRFLIGLAGVSVITPSPVYAQQETLEQAWIKAYRNNPSLEAQRANLRAIDEQVSQALSHWRPSIDATASLGKTHQEAPDLSAFGQGKFSDTTRNYGIQVTQPLFRGFRTLAETESAKKQVMASRAKLEGAEQQLFLDVGSAYLGILRDEAALKLQLHHEEVLQDKLKETKTRAKIGDLTETDVRQAESRLARARAGRYQTENTLTQDREAYKRLVGSEPGNLMPPVLVMAAPQKLSELLSLAQSNNPEVVAASFTVEQSKADVRLNKGALLPEVNLVGNMNRSYGQSITVPGREDTSQVLVQLTMPLYRSGTDYSKTRAAEQTVTQRRDELDEVRHKAHEAAANGWQGLLTSEATLQADDSEITAGTEALKGVKEQSRVGTRNTLDVLNAEQELLDAQIDQVKSRRDRNFAILQIDAAVGTLTVEHLKLPIKFYDPNRHYEDVKGQWVGFSEEDSRYAVDAAKLALPPE